MNRCAIPLVLAPAKQAGAFPLIVEERIDDPGFPCPSPPVMLRSCAVAIADSSIPFACDGGNTAGDRRGRSGRFGRATGRSHGRRRS